MSSVRGQRRVRSGGSLAGATPPSARLLRRQTCGSSERLEPFLKLGLLYLLLRGVEDEKEACGRHGGQDEGTSPRRRKGRTEGTGGEHQHCRSEID